MDGIPVAGHCTRENATLEMPVMKKTTFLLLPSLLAILATVLPLRAADEAWFPFGVPVFTDDAPAFDLSWMNEKPAGKSGWLRVDGERFVNATGGVVRLVGANITAKGNFPDPKDAPIIARHLAQYGCNVIRMHFLDNQWGSERDRLSLLPFSNDTAGGLETNALARLDAFLAALRTEGIYVNLNLHVGRDYPGLTKDMPHMSKGVDNFMPSMIQALKDYARLLMNHVNPHTGRAYKDDPAICMLEISNEDSLLLNPWWIEKLQEPAAGELRTRYNAWLRTRYADTAALRESWGVDSGYQGADILPAGGLAKWRIERHGGSDHAIRALPDGTARWVGIARGSESWHMQLSSDQIALRDGQRFELKLRARSPTGNGLALAASQTGAPWNGLGFNTDVALGPEWKDFTFHITPAGVTTQSGARLVLSLKNSTGIVEIASILCRPVSSGYLKPDQTFEAGPLPLPNQGAPWNVRRDFFAFLADVETSFGKELSDFLKKDLGCKALVADSQVLFGGPMGARREFLVSDFVDTHGYWHHPSWPNKQWDRRDWYIVNESQIKSWDGGTLTEMAMQRPVGKPYTVSEYDIPAPNDHQAELWPTLAAMACFQDWSALYHYTLVHELDQYRSEKIDGYFNEIGNPAKDAMRPIGALIFRLGLVRPGRECVTLRVNDTTLIDLATRQNGQMWGSWRELWQREAKQNGSLALRFRTGLDIAPTAASSALLGAPPAAAKPPYVTDTGEWNWDTEAGIFVLNAPAVRIWSGRLGGKSWKAGDTTLTVGTLDEPSPNATAVLVALDGKPLGDSSRLLLTALRRVENEGMVWNEKRNSVGDQWGRGPARVLGFEGRLNLPAGRSWKVEALGATGKVRSLQSDAAPAVSISPKERTMWWLLTRQP